MSFPLFEHDIDRLIQSSKSKEKQTKKRSFNASEDLNASKPAHTESSSQNSSSHHNQTIVKPPSNMEMDTETISSEHSEEETSPVKKKQRTVKKPITGKTGKQRGIDNPNPFYATRSQRPT